MMMAEAAKKYDYKVIGLDPNKNCSLSHIADEMISADYNDEKGIKELMSKVDFVTYEFENVDLDMISKYEHKIPQKRDALHYSRNRLIEKDFASNLGIKTPRYKLYQNSDIFYPSIIKTTEGGYDGKGQWVINDILDIDRLIIDEDIEYIIEEKIEFDYEISVVVTRDAYGNKAFYPIPINEHRNGILFTSSVFDEVDSLIVSKAHEYTSKLVEKLDYVGTLAIEYFVKGNDVIFNEFAPRPHNSGHYTIEGCNISQFENHIRAISGLKVIQPKLVSPTIMINVLGQDNDFIKRINYNSVYHHTYYKVESRVNRKMGHITIVTDTKEQGIEIKNNIIKE